MTHLVGKVGWGRGCDMIRTSVRRLGRASSRDCAAFKCGGHGLTFELLVGICAAGQATDKLWGRVDGDAQFRGS